MPQHTQHYSYPDVDAYTVRVQAQDNSRNSYQIISISSDNNIKILTLNDSFVQEFTTKKIAALAEPSIELVEEMPELPVLQKRESNRNKATNLAKRLE